MQTTFSIKVDARFAKEFRLFCGENCLQVGRFAEKALREVMEDYHFGRQAQAILGRSAGKTLPHAKLPRP